MENQFRDVFEAAPDGIVVVDDEGMIRELNPAAVEMFGYEREELLGERVEVLVPEESRSGHAAQRDAYLGEPRARPMGIGMELRGRRKDGSTFPVEISLSPLRTDEGLRVISTVRDVTERNRLRRFGAGALRAAEEERRRIARELHDDMAQRLATLLLHLRLLRDVEEPDERSRLLSECREHLQRTAESVRRIARGLRPPALEDAGLEAALRSDLRSRTGGLGLEVEFEAEPVDQLLDEEERLAIYRIVQEALSNTIRHADASRLRIRLGVEDGAVVASVEDDGRGFDVDGIQGAEGSGLGLLGIEERARLAGGSVEIESAPGQGTRVRLTIPTDEGEEREEVHV